MSPGETELLDAIRSRDHHRIEHALIALDVRLSHPPVKSNPTDGDEGDRVGLAAKRIRESADTIQRAAEALRDAADVLVDT